MINVGLIGCHFVGEAIGNIDIYSLRIANENICFKQFCLWW